MKVGQQIYWLRSNKPPLQCENLELVCAWRFFGGGLLEGDSFSDTVEKKDGGVERVVTWCIDGDTSAVVNGVPIQFPDFLSLWNSEAACGIPELEAIRSFSKDLQGMRSVLRERKPSVLMRKGNRLVVIPATATQEEREKLLAAF